MSPRRARAVLVAVLAAIAAWALIAAPADATKRGRTTGAHFTLRGEVLTVNVSVHVADRLAGQSVSVACGPTLTSPLSALVREWNPRRHADRFVAIFALPVESRSHRCGIGDPASNRWYLRATVR
jgi:hypothetical protein